MEVADGFLFGIGGISALERIRYRGIGTLEKHHYSGRFSLLSTT